MVSLSQGPFAGMRVCSWAVAAFGALGRHPFFRVLLHGGWGTFPTEKLQMLLNAVSALVGWLSCYFSGTISFGLKMNIPASVSWFKHHSLKCPPRENLVCSLVLLPCPPVSSSTSHRSCWGKKAEVCFLFQVRHICCVTLTEE